MGSRLRESHSVPLLDLRRNRALFLEFALLPGDFIVANIGLHGLALMRALGVAWSIA